MSETNKKAETVKEVWEKIESLWKKGKVKVDHDYRCGEEVADWRTKVELKGEISESDKESYRRLAEMCKCCLIREEQKKGIEDMMVFEFEFGENYDCFLGRNEQESKGICDARDKANSFLGITENMPLVEARKIKDALPKNVRGHELTEEERNLLVKRSSIKAVCTEGASKPYGAMIRMKLAKTEKGVKPVLTVTACAFVEKEAVSQKKGLSTQKHGIGR